MNNYLSRNESPDQAEAEIHFGLMLQRSLREYCIIATVTKCIPMQNMDVLSSGASKIVKILNTIPEGRTGREMILDSSSKQTQGIMAMLLQYTAILELMATEDGGFSIRKWLHDPQARHFIFS